MISKDDVQHIASLSRISLKQKEIDSLTKDLENILNYVASLEKLDLTKTQPTSHVLPLKNVTREDSVHPTFNQEKALTIAVKKRNGAFEVPKVIE